MLRVNMEYLDGLGKGFQSQSHAQAALRAKRPPRDMI